MRLTIQTFNMETIAKQLAKNADQAEKALKATGNDMRKRVPGMAASEVTEVYNIKKKEITPASKPKAGAKPKKMAGSIKLAGQTVSSVTIEYTGRTLTPTHFAMKPKTRRANPKRKHRKRTRPAPKKEITAEIKNGQRKSLGPHVFLGGNGSGGYIPFERKGPGRKADLEAIRTVSMPQMIDNPKVREEITEKVNVLLEKRLKHNIERFIK